MNFTTQNTRVRRYSRNFRGDFAVLERIDGSPLFDTMQHIDDAAVVAYQPNDFDGGLSIVGVSDGRWGSSDEEPNADFSGWGETTSEVHQRLVDFANKMDEAE